MLKKEVSFDSYEERWSDTPSTNVKRDRFGPVRV